MGGNGSHLEVTWVALVHHDSFSHDFVPSQSFGKLLDILPETFLSLKTLNSEFSHIEYGLLIKVLNHES